MIYFIQAGENGPIKIGQTNNGIEGRIAQLQTGCPYELRLLWLYKGYCWTEAEIHAKFKLLHIRGEWFKPSKNIFSFIGDCLHNDYPINLNNNNKEVVVSEYYPNYIRIKETNSNIILDVEVQETVYMRKKSLDVLIDLRHDTIKHLHKTQSE